VAWESRGVRRNPIPVSRSSPSGGVGVVVVVVVVVVVIKTHVRNLIQHAHTMKKYASRVSALLTY
jgi:hypothetical protein